jgi:hypothetical protein
MAVVIEVMHWSSTAYYKSNRIPGYTEPSSTPSV